MNQKNHLKQPENLHNAPNTEGDDTMSAVAQNYVYQVSGKLGAAKKEPTVTEDRLANIKASIGKYLSNKK